MIIRAVGLDELAPDLALGPDRGSLPALVDCPLCGNGGMAVVPDQHNASKCWYDCRGCGFTGDALELSGAVAIGREAPAADRVRAAIARLTDSTRIDNAAYRAEVAARREKHLKAIKSSRDRAAEVVRRDLRARRLLAALGLPTADDPDRSGVRLLGLLSRADANAFVPPNRNPGVMRAGGEIKASNLPSERKMGEPEVVVLPFWLSRGVPGGVLFASLDVYGNLSLLWRSIFPSPTSAQNDACFGACFLDAVPPPGGPTGDALFALSDPIEAMLTQDRSIRESGEAVPVIGLTTAPGFQPALLPLAASVGRTVVLVTRRVDGAAATIACRSGCRVYACGDWSSWRSSLARVGPRGTLARALTESVPWEEALSTYASTLPVESAAAMVKRLKVDPWQRDAVMAALPAHVAAACRPPVGGRRFHRSSGGVLYIEDSGVWVRDRNYLHCKAGRRTPTVIANGIVRIESLRRYSLPTPHTVAEGYVRFKGADYPFCERIDVMERGGFRWARDLILDAGGGFLEYYRHACVNMVDLAVHFWPPAQHPCSDRIGWCNQVGGFTWASATLLRDGTQTKCLLSPELKKVFPDLPTRDYAVAESWHPGAVRALSGSGSRPLWALAVAIVHEATGPATLRRPHGLRLLLGSLPKSTRPGVVAAARALGCSTVEATHEVLRNWPACTTDDGSSGRQISVCLPGTLSRDWEAEIRSWPRLTSAAEQSLRSLVPTFLRWWLKRDRTLRALRTPTDTAALMGEWFALMGGDKKVFAGSAKWFKPVTEEIYDEAKDSDEPFRDGGLRDGEGPPDGGRI